MNRIAKLERRRSLSLFWFLVGFLIWQGGRVAAAFSPSFNPFSPIVIGLALLGWAVWTYHLVRLLLLQRKMSDQQHRQMNDERVQKNRQRSFTVGFWAILGTTGLLLVLQSLFTVTAAAELVLLIGVVSSVGAFLYFESKGL